MQKTIFALDESGQFTFEDNSVKGLNFVTALMYMDTEQNTRAEKNRIRRYLSWICRSVQGSYPASLHNNRFSRTGSENGSAQDANWNDPVITLVSETLPAFLRGTVSDPETASENETAAAQYAQGRRGLYYFSVNVAGEHGKSRFKEDAGFLNDDNTGANLYMHMTEDLVIRTLFHNPYVKITDCDLLIAQRSLQVSGDSPQASSLDQMQYRRNGNWLATANSDTYRTRIAAEEAQHGSGDLRISKLWCDSIPYYPHQQADAPANVEYLYLVDLICSYIRNKYRTSSPNSRVTKLNSELSELTGTPAFVFAYTDIDDAFKDAWKATEDKEYFKALSISYDAVQPKSLSLKDYYETVLFPLIPKRIISDQDESHLTAAIDDLYQFAIHTQNLDQKKLYSLLNTFHSIIADVCRTGRPSFEPELRYSYYMVGQAAYNHLGAPDKANAYFKLAQAQSKKRVEFSQLLLARCQKIVSFLDQFLPEKAVDLAEITIATEKNVARTKRIDMEDPQSPENGNIDLGIAYSQAGQVYAFIRNPKAENLFFQAIREFNSSEEDRYRTYTYLLHHYIDMNEEDKYYSYANLLFGGETDPDKQYEWLMAQAGKKDNPFTLDYLLLVYIKAQCVFRRKHTETFPDYVKDFRKHQIDMNNHPWELIYKYLAFLQFETENRNGYDHTQSEKLMKKTEDAVPTHEFATDAIVAYGYIQYSLITGKDCREEIIDLYRRIHHLKEDQTVDAKLALKDLQNRFTFMYV